MINTILQPGKTLLSPADHMPILIGQSEICLDSRRVPDAAD
jgi:hypothetical protein